MVGYDASQALDLTGPMDAFAAANEYAPGSAAYELIIVGLNAGAFRTESGALLIAEESLNAGLQADTILIPGGRGLREDARLRGTIADWLRRHAHIRRLASVCTGIYPLAESGLLDGRQATTHWRFADDVRKRWPRVHVVPDAIFVKDGNFYTSAGITAGIDLALALIEEDLGSAIALSVARELVVHLKRDGGQLQYSEPLQFQTRAGNLFADLGSWMLAHLDEDLATERLAEHARLSERHFRRRFHATFGATPAQYVESLRLDEARRRLEMRKASVDVVARSVGYKSPDVFRRAFERRFGVAPTAYRARFMAS
ncbi:MAG: DJ-1/PfpI family protein [Candidatus Eremiobacteraeota bacterium]|nr:DJ-1/PfpI family protein [Candidatus Eremiobacteraeota bacterium]